MSDPRTECVFCLANHDEHVPATTVAPQHDGGDEDRPAVWVPVCDMHFDGWYDDVDEPLPAFKLVVAE